MFPKKRHVTIDSEGRVDNEEDGQVSVVVTFPDRTSWLTHFYTFKCVESIRQNYLSLGNRPYMCPSNPLILVDIISRARIEAVIDEDEVKQILFGERDEGAYNLNLLDVLKDRNIIVSQLNNQGPELKNKWANIFTKDLSYEEQQLIYFDQFLWHLFSYKKRPCLKNELAIEAFNNLKKQQCFIFYQDRDHALFVINGADLELDYFELDSDIYIVDKDFKWTYVKTHESDCGPYFCEL